MPLPSERSGSGVGFLRYENRILSKDMKLRNKDTKKYLLSVAVSTFVAYVLPSMFLYLGVYDGIIGTICICLLNVSTALFAWRLAKADSKMSLLKWHLGLNSLVTLLLMGIAHFSVTNGNAIFLIIVIFIWLGIFNLFTLGLSLAVYSFIQGKIHSKRKI